MNHLRKLHSSRLARFLLVGAGNSTINFIVLNAAFYSLRQGKIASSILATSCAIVFSFALNRSFVFRDKDRPLGKFVRFILVSAGGVLLIQTSTYALSVTLLQYFVNGSFALINLSNLLASFVVMFWNYNGYRLLVFIGGENRSARTENDITVSEVEAE